MDSTLIEANANMCLKRLVPGSIVLGQVSQINRYDLALNLPNNLTGFVPLTAISDIFIKRLEALAAKEEEVDGKDEDKGVELANMVSVGQYLRAYVTSTERESTTNSKAKRHIELSLNPREANRGLKQSDLVVNGTVQAAVLSVQDRGLIMDLGLQSQGVQGFMPLKQLGPNVNLSSIEEGAIYTCLIIGKSSAGNTITLAADPQKMGNVKQGNLLTDAPSIDAYLPGTAVEILLSEVTSTGIAGKVMGVLDVTADLIHSGAAASGKDLEKKYTTGSKVKGRIICTFPTVEENKLGVSLQDHILNWVPKTMTSTNVVEKVLPTALLAISSIVDRATVVKTEQGIGLLLDVGVKGVRGFVHISQISDGKIETLSESSGPYKLGSVHRARITGFNAMDGVFIASMESKVIGQPFLRIEDVKIGQVVKGTIEKLLVSETGVDGIIVKIAENITGLVPEMHLADVHLQHPERKFKEGMAVIARVLSTNVDKRQIRLSLKKALVNTEVEPWTTYKNLQRGLQSPGTLVKVSSDGAVVQFYGPVRAFLPVKEMSESFIQDPRQHFRLGQVVNVRIITDKPAEGNLIVSCKDPTAFSVAEEQALSNLKLGESVTGKVIEKTKSDLVVVLEPSNLKASLSFEHLVDGSAQKCASAAKKIRVDQTLKDLVILSKQESKCLVKLTSKPSLLKTAKDGKILSTFEDVEEGAQVHGFVRNVTSTGVFVQFFGDLTALLLKQHLPEEAIRLPDFGMRRDQSITTRVLAVDHGQRRFLLTLKPLVKSEETATKKSAPEVTQDRKLSNAIDEVSESIDDFVVGKLTKAKINSVKATQLNVRLADKVQGRIDVSEAFDSWEEINDQQHPLKKFNKYDVVPVRILGMHDSRNHRFLPITHRGKAPVFELTAKPSSQGSDELDILTNAKVEVGSSWVVFVNNVADGHLWVNLSPNVRGRIRAMDASDNVSMLDDLPKNFPVGSAMRAKVLKVDIDNNRIELSARSGASTAPSALSDLTEGAVLPGRVTKVTQRQVMVQLSESLSGPLHLVDLADDYSQANPATYHKNQTIRVCVTNIDLPNKRLTLSARLSKVLSSTLPVKDPDITSVEQLKVNDVRRGFIKNVADNGIFVLLASNVTAYVRVTDLSDDYLKDWKAGFAIDQLVEGKVIAVDPTVNHVQLSLKRSQLDSNYKPPLTFNDVRVGQKLTGKVRKVEDYGVFIVIDNSANVSGLCHRTKMADNPNADPKKLYEEGDLVKAKVLYINKDQKRISFGLKASYFKDQAQDSQHDHVNSQKDQRSASEDVDSDDGELSVDGKNGVALNGADDDGDSEGSGISIDLDNVKDADSDGKVNDISNGGVELPYNNNSSISATNGEGGLSTGGFNWTEGADDHMEQSETDIESIAPKIKKKKRKPEIKIDRTGDLDAYGPQSKSDFERLLMTQANNSAIWIEYMTFQVKLSEISAARELAERALNTIAIEEQSEKFNVWMAWLNLENLYGDEESEQRIFKRACEYNDPLEVHTHLASIYIQSSTFAKADELFQTTLKKFNQDLNLYINYATFLFTQLDAPARARALLPRALQSLPKDQHRDITFKFAQLEFTTPHGNPERGRTVFENLLAQWPKRTDFWNVLLDLEIKQGDVEVVRRLFERMTGGGLKLKLERAKKLFKKWLEWEGKFGTAKTQERVKALAADYVSRQKKL